MQFFDGNLHTTSFLFCLNLLRQANICRMEPKKWKLMLHTWINQARLTSFYIYFLYKIILYIQFLIFDYVSRHINSWKGETNNFHKSTNFYSTMYICNFFSLTIMLVDLNVKCHKRENWLGLNIYQGAYALLFFVTEVIHHLHVRLFD